MPAIKQQNSCKLNLLISGYRTPVYCVCLLPCDKTPVSCVSYTLTREFLSIPSLNTQVTELRYTAFPYPQDTELL